MNSVWTNRNSGLEIGRPTQLYSESSVKYQIILSKVSDDTAVLRIQYSDEEGNVKTLLTHNYRWNDQFETLVAVECEQVPEYVPSIIKDVCL